MPSTNTFDAPGRGYKESVLPAAVTRRVAVEAGVPSRWWRYVGLKGQIVGIDHFGASAPAKDAVSSSSALPPSTSLEAIEKTAGG